MKADELKANRAMCKTCPYRKGSPYSDLQEAIGMTLMEGSRICHSTGSNAINANTGKKEKLCRGARDIQLKIFAGIGFLSEATDKAWSEKLAQLSQ